MSKGHDRYHERNCGLSIFGKDLVRRSGAHCELCGDHGVKLHIYEVAAVSKLPDLNHCLMVCDVCFTQIEKPKLQDNNHWRCLNHSIWSEVPVVKVLAVAILKRVAEQNFWAVQLLEQVYLEPEEREWLAKVQLP
ncbi:phnA protein [Neptuniibacter marinus]|uniref:phnA protein n=1 Tax=Neptuniibacter marinus TaxID=1806670 RepID=UPI003B58C121